MLFLYTEELNIQKVDPNTFVEVLNILDRVRKIVCCIL